MAKENTFFFLYRIRFLGKHTITGTIVVHNQNRLSGSNTTTKYTNINLKGLAPLDETFLAQENGNRFFVINLIFWRVLPSRKKKTSRARFENTETHRKTLFFCMFIIFPCEKEEREITSALKKRQKR